MLLMMDLEQQLEKNILIPKMMLHILKMNFRIEFYIQILMLQILLKMDIEYLDNHIIGIILNNMDRL